MYGYLMIFMVGNTTFRIEIDRIHGVSLRFRVKDGPWAMRESVALRTRQAPTTASCHEIRSLRVSIASFSNAFDPSSTDGSM